MPEERGSTSSTVSGVIKQRRQKIYVCNSLQDTPHNEDTLHVVRVSHTFH